MKRSIVKSDKFVKLEFLKYKLDILTTDPIW